MQLFKLQPIFCLHIGFCKQQNRKDKVQWCIDALNIFATTKQKQQDLTMHQCD
jgi:hypothetical protein